MGQTPQQIIDNSRMSWLQIAAVAIMVCLNAIDGFDVLAISFVSPNISAEWGIDRAALGIVLSMELIGMAVGSVLLGGVADRIGRRPTILGCLVVMSAGMYMASTAHNITELSVWRVLTGLGIGGMLAAINAVAAEFANAKYRKISLAIMVIGYPLGAVFGGLVAKQLLAAGDWRAVFVFGSLATAFFIPLVWFLSPETVAYLDERRPAGALDKINRTLRRMGHAQADTLSEPTIGQAKRSLADLFKPGLLGTTVFVTLAYFAHILSFYFILKWIPKIVVDMGFNPASAADVLVWANVGGATGGVIFGLLAQRISLKYLTICVLVAACGLVVWFGQGQSDLQQLAMTAAIVGVFTNAGVVGLYSIFAIAFPTHVRATGTGFAIGIGRGGAALAPAAAGFLFSAGVGLPTVAMVMGSGSLIAALCLLGVRMAAEPKTKAAAA